MCFREWVLIFTLEEVELRGGCLWFAGGPVVVGEGGYYGVVGNVLGRLLSWRGLVVQVVGCLSVEVCVFCVV